MAKDLTVALDTVEMTYGQIKQLADEMLLSTFTPINDLIATVSNNIEGMSTEMLRDYLLRVQLAAFSISELKDRASVKATCAEAIRKEAYATSYLGQEGTQSAKDQCLYELVASLVKTKLDSLYRMADTMKSVLMSRMQEAKFMNLGTTNEVSPTTNGRVTLNE